MAEIRAAAIADARRILTAAEREVLLLRAALQGVLDELATGHHAGPGAPFLALAPEIEEPRTRTTTGTTPPSAR